MSALDPESQNKQAKFDKNLTVLEKRDQHKRPTKVLDVEKPDPSLRPKLKKLNFVNKLEQA